MTEGEWFTDGLVVWARSAGGPAVCTMRNLTEREGTLAPVSDLAEQAGNARAIACLPRILRGIDTALAASNSGDLHSLGIALANLKTAVAEARGLADSPNFQTRKD